MSLPSLAAGLLGAGLRRAARVRNRGFMSALPHQAGAPTLLLSPHLDDAALNCWSVLTGGEALSVVTVFAGLPPDGRLTNWDRIVRAKDSAQLLRQRRDEDHVALAVAGHRPLHLDFVEVQHRRNSPEPSFRALDDAVRAVVPAACRVLAPMSLGSVHPDHLLLRQYALALWRGGMPVTLYADVPYAVVYGWPAWVTGEPADPHLDVDAYWGQTLPTSPTLAKPRVVGLHGEAASDKLRALQAYRTQFSSLDRGPLGLLSNPMVHPFEVFWDMPS